MKPPLWLLTAWLAIALAAWPVARQKIEAARKVPPDDLVASQRFLQNKRYPEAIAAAQRYLRRKPDSVPALTNLGIGYANQNKWDDAIAATQQALLHQPDDQLAWNNLRWMLASKLAVHPTAEAYEGEAFNRLQARDYRGCIQSVQQALKLYPQYTKAFNMLSVCYLNLGRYDDAIANAREALRIEPAFQLARNNLALAIGEKARNAAALRTVSPPPVPPSQQPGRTAQDWLNSSVTHYRAGRMRECIDDAREALKLQPVMALAYNNIAACSNDLGRADDAIAAAGAALRLQPDFQLARNNLAVALNLKKQQAARQ